MKEIHTLKWNLGERANKINTSYMANELIKTNVDMHCESLDITVLHKILRANIYANIIPTHFAWFSL